MARFLDAMSIGILLINGFSHWDESNVSQLAELITVSPGLPVVTVPETEYVVFYQ